MPRRPDRRDEAANRTISQELTGFHKERKRTKKKEIYYHCIFGVSYGKGGIVVAETQG